MGAEGTCDYTIDNTVEYSGILDSNIETFGEDGFNGNIPAGVTATVYHFALAVRMPDGNYSVKWQVDGVEKGTASRTYPKQNVVLLGLKLGTFTVKTGKEHICAEIVR